MNRLFNNLYKKPFEKGDKVMLIQEVPDINMISPDLIPGNVFTVDEIGGNIFSMEEFPGTYFHKKLFTFKQDVNLEIDITEGLERIINKGNFTSRLAGNPLLKTLNFKGSDVLRVTTDFVYLKMIPGIVGGLLDCKVQTYLGELALVVPSKRINFSYISKAFIRKDEVLIDKERFRNQYCHGKDDTLRFYSYNKTGANEQEILLNTIPLIDSNYIKLTFSHRTPNGTIFWEIAPSIYLANISGYEIYKLVKEKVPFEQGNPVFVKSAQITGEIKKVLKTSGGIYYHVLLDTGKECTTRSKNLKLIK